MHHIDSIKEVMGTLLPRQHINLIALLLMGLLVLAIMPVNQHFDEMIEADTTPIGPATPPAIVKEPEPLVTAPEPEPDTRLHITVKPGDNLSLLFGRAGLSAQDVYNVINSNPDSKILSSLYPGYTLAFEVTNDNLISMEIMPSRLESYLFVREDQGSSYSMRHIQREPEIIPSYKEAVIEDSLFMAATKGGISAPITMELASVFSGVIDFMLDTRKGDTFNVLYEEKYHEGEFIGNGAILAAQFTNQGETYTAFRYVNEAGDVGYYNPQGESMKKAFLRNPIDIVRISSDFSLARKHPILNTIRAHKGTDYAAPRGTPVQSTSDGRVVWAARNGSFGKLVVIQHGDRFQTKYAHLDDYASGIKTGARVRQGQVIGYVGSTGSATGPHLHYEFLMDGVHRNYRTIHDKLPKAESIADSERQRFTTHTRQLLAQLNSGAKRTLTLAQNTLNDKE